MKATILRGALFLIPVIFLIMILTKAFELSLILAKPAGKVFPMDNVAGVLVVDILAVFLILLTCLLGGFIAKRGRLFGHMNRLDEFLIDILPGYAVTKGLIGGVADEEDAVSVLRPVLVRFDDYEQMAFEVERLEDRVVIFLPGSPSAWSGSSLIVNADRVTHLNLPPHQVVSLLRVMGRGSAKLSLNNTPSSASA
ncbi:MAG: hypothetical protein JKY94_12395 [Rhodobacteraceae bacterium]|nr:hypothetical protein [Paracoccaceae bacterium]